MPQPEPVPLGYEPPQGKPRPGAYMAAGAAVAMAMLIAHVAYRTIDWRLELASGPGGGGTLEFPLWFQLAVSGATGVVATASLGGLVSLAVALGATARRAFRRGL